METTKLTSEQKRIAIAEACGWKKVMPEIDKAWGYKLKDKAWAYPHHIPDYLQDLNAIQQAVLAQDEDFKKEFSRQQYKIIAKNPPWHGPIPFYQLTASDWCDCFLQALEARKKA